MGYHAAGVVLVTFLGSHSLGPLELKKKNGEERLEEGLSLGGEGRQTPTGEQCKELDETISKSCNSLLLLLLLLWGAGRQISVFLSCIQNPLL